jgi:hypothetical protein
LLIRSIRPELTAAVRNPLTPAERLLHEQLGRSHVQLAHVEPDQDSREAASFEALGARSELFGLLARDQGIDLAGGVTV